MCVIIDKNVVGDLFADTGSNFKPFFDWMGKDGCVVYGGKKYRTELAGSSNLRTFMVVWKRTGKAREMDDNKVDTEQKRIKPECTSDDSHIIALARVSGARVLILKADKNLEQDFKDRELINKPRGRIYKNESHRRLLHHDRSCGRL